MADVHFILGTMTFGSQADAGESRDIISFFFQSGFNEIDTAYVYNDGGTEKILGKTLSPTKKVQPVLATKAHPRATGSLDGQSVRMQLEQSLQRLKRKKVELFYLHAPDPATPIEQTLEMCSLLHEEGKFEQLGLSNFPSWMVVKIWYLCERKGWPRPAVYQGMYNALSRKPEAELFPALRDLGIRFYAYNPLAGGLLTGKYRSFNEKPSEGRFADMPFYQDRYWKKSLFKAIDEVGNLCWAEGISPAEAAFRWIACHSSLDFRKGDGIILGVTSLKQLQQNISACEQGKLPEHIAAAFEHAWEVGRAESPDYYRFYTG